MIEEDESEITEIMIRFRKKVKKDYICAEDAMNDIEPDYIEFERRFICADDVVRANKGGETDCCGHDKGPLGTNDDASQCIYPWSRKEKPKPRTYRSELDY